jgi:multidrug efflux pump
MNISAPFIARPIATSLVTIGVALAGFVSFFLLPVAPMPDTDLPVIVVQAQMAGASPETMATSVATPLERHLGAISDVDEMTSSSSVGSTRVILQFGFDRDIDGAARDVQAAINASRADLPASLRSNPTYRKINPANFPIMILALTSDTLSPGQMYDSANTILQQRLSQISGIGQVQVLGASLPAVRIDLNPQALFKYGVGLEDIRAALSATNANAPKGALNQSGSTYQVYTNDQATTADQYRSLIVAYRNNAPVRLSDIASVYDGVENIQNLGMLNGKPAVLVALYKQPGANIVATVDRVKALLPELAASIPPAIHLINANDRTGAIRKSLGDVERSLILSVILVTLVVFFFLRDARATIIPGIAVPLSLVATFGIMYLVSYSLNDLSLMALTVATGFVIDDAIVVLENITRHIEAGMPKMEAVLLGSGEVGFTVMSMSLSLIAVFIPILLMSGIIGEIFRQFALTLSMSIVVSLLASLTTTPMLCRYLSKRDPERKQGRLMQWSERVFERSRDAYERALLWALRYPGTIMIILVVTICLNVWLFYLIPKDFLPSEDTGDINGNITADQSVSFQLMEKKFAQFMSIVKSDPAVDSVVGSVGSGGGGPRGGATNTGSIFVQLKPANERDLSTDQVIDRLRPKLSSIAGARMQMFGAQDVRAGGRQSNASYQYTLLADSYEDLAQWVPRITDALQDQPELEDVNSDQQAHGLEIELSIDRQTASRLGITVAQIDNTLYDAFGQRTVSTIYKDNNQYFVVMGVAPQFWQSPQTLNDIYVSTSAAPVTGTQSTNAVVGTTVISGATAASASQIASDSLRNQQLNSIASSSRGGSAGSSVSTAQETMVPLSAFASFAPGNTPLAVNHQGPFVATTFSFNLPAGGSLGEATNAIQRVMAAIRVPVTIHGEFAGNAKIFTQSLSSQPMLVLTAIIAVYIVLGVLYESYIHPLTILSTLPSAGVGAVLALILTHTTFTLLALIGVLLLVGIVKKNAIMMIDFALDAERNQGLSAREAIFQACLMRFRPIMMTTFAAILGALPLALGLGTSFSQSLGIAIVGGLIVSQALTLFTTPVVYLYMDRFRLWCRGLWQRWYLGALGDPESPAAPAE